VNVSSRIRPLIAVALAVIVVAGLVTADVVTLHKAKPSYDHETQAFTHLLGPSKTAGLPASTTLPPSSGASPNSAVTSSTIGTSGITGTPAATSGSASTTTAAPGSP
jgi:hypothetical protein